jgi:hypothetical protein
VISQQIEWHSLSFGDYDLLMLNDVTLCMVVGHFALFEDILSLLFSAAIPLVRGSGVHLGKLLANTNFESILGKLGAWKLNFVVIVNCFPDISWDYLRAVLQLVKFPVNRKP